jgi:hypothetical protein
MNATESKVSRTKAILSKYNKLRKIALSSMSDKDVKGFLQEGDSGDYEAILEALANLDA